MQKKIVEISKHYVRYFDFAASCMQPRNEAELWFDEEIDR